MIVAASSDRKDDAKISIWQRKKFDRPYRLTAHKGLKKVAEDLVHLAMLLLFIHWLYQNSSVSGTKYLGHGN